MVERVARALAKADRLEPDEDPNYVSQYMMTDMAYPPEARLWWRYIPKAKAAIAAMREPTEPMTIAAAIEPGELMDRMIAAQTWRVMIEAALVVD